MEMSIGKMEKESSKNIFDYGDCMTPPNAAQKLTKRQRIVCCIIAFCAAVAYVGAFLYYARTAWGRHDGDLPPVSSWVESFGRDLILFPFGLLPGLAPVFGSIIFFLNISFWSTASVLVYVLFCRRKNAA